MLESKIRFEIIVLVQIVRLAVAIAPVLVVFKAISADLFETEFRRSLLMLFRRAESGEYQGIPWSCSFGDIQHVGPGTDIRPVDISGTSDIRAEKTDAPSLPYFTGIQ